MKKFKYAFNGLRLALKEKAFIIQVVLGILAVIGGLIIKLDYYEWLAFIICIFLVLTLEILNSVIEKLCDLYSLEENNKIKVIKDMSASFVLVFSFGALIICLICLFRRII